MYCGTAAGQFLYPMVVYKAANCYIEWTYGGPPGTIFDSRTFERWFREIFIPETASLTGTKVVIGDNLTSHFSSDIIKACLENNIRFTCLIPNAPHLLQPLDIAVFRPLKVEWKKILQSWRRESRIKGSIPKNHFPALSTNLQNTMKADNLKAGFEASGIYPLNQEKVLKRLPDVNKDYDGETIKEILNEGVIDILTKYCGNDVAGKTNRKRGGKIAPGKSIAIDDIDYRQTSNRKNPKTKK